MSILSTNSVTLQDTKDQLLKDVYEKNNVFFTIKKDRLGKDIHEGDIVFCINSHYGHYDILVGEITGFTDLKVKVKTYVRHPVEYESTESFSPNDIIRMEIGSIRDMFDIKN